MHVKKSDGEQKLFIIGTCMYANTIEDRGEKKAKSFSGEWKDDKPTSQ